MGGEEGGRPSRGPLALCLSNPRGLAVGRRSNGATPTAALERETRSQFVVDRRKNRVKVAVANASDRHPTRHCMYMPVLELVVWNRDARFQMSASRVRQQGSLELILTSTSLIAGMTYAAPSPPVADIDACMPPGRPTQELKLHKATIRGHHGLFQASGHVLRASFDP